jgi:AraC-like DNA-binding protein
MPTKRKPTIGSIHRPHPALGVLVHQYFTVGAAAEASTRRVVPDGSVHLIFNLGEVRGKILGVLEPQACVIGVMTAPITVERPAASSPLLGVSLAAGAASMLLDGDVSSFNNRVIDLRSLWGHEAQYLLDHLIESQTTADRLRHMDTFLLRKLNAAREPDPMLAPAIDLIRRHRGRLSMSAVGSELGVSERRLERTFRFGTGLSPKEFSRITRIHAVLARIPRLDSDATWVKIASELGFADQAHLIREFRALTGVTPARYGEGNVSYVFSDALAVHDQEAAGNSP